MLCVELSSSSSSRPQRMSHFFYFSAGFENSSLRYTPRRHQRAHLIPRRMITATNHGHLSRSPTSTPSWLPRLANFASSTPPKHSKKDDSSESKGVSPRVHAVSYLGLDGGSDEEEEESVEDLLWSAQVSGREGECKGQIANGCVQMDLIGHRKAPAISKLRQAVALGSSAACATLAK